jgi:predicted dehydrogenase
LDVDVVYDVMIHDLDILLALAASPVAEVRSLGIPVVTDKVDIAHARLEFASGAVASVTASRVSIERVRKMRFFQAHEYISVDPGDRTLRIRVRQPANPLISSSCQHGHRSRWKASCARFWTPCADKLLP